MIAINMLQSKQTATIIKYNSTSALLFKKNMTKNNNSLQVIDSKLTNKTMFATHSS